MDQSLDEFIKAKKESRRNTPAAAASTTPVSTGPSPMESSLDNIIQSQQKQRHNNRYSNGDGHVKRTNTFNKRQYNNTHDTNKNIVVTVQNNQGYGRYSYPQTYNSHYQSGGGYHGRGGYNNALTHKKIVLSKQIDHSLFDPRGIRDYSQAGSRQPKYGRHGFYDIEDLEEMGATLRIKNIAPSVTLADIGRAFGIIGPVKDFDLLTHLSPVEAVVTYRRRLDAMSAMERFNGTELDGSELRITLELNESSTSTTSTPPAQTKSDQAQQEQSEDIEDEESMNAL
ncbi:hypothetical protein SAMD00019534_045550, partial [Acytostelium subglobosum LB1]|uniref:hypothetical protein n=1 Tax=Acytostelium subglobosum LB1 TaxID=1410327 RepID=UPI000644ADB1